MPLCECVCVWFGLDSVPATRIVCSACPWYETEPPTALLPQH
jgi:hypothetical protein